MRPPELSVVVPAYNESHRLPRTLHEVRGWLEARDLAYEVLVADDGSRDRTRDAVRQIQAGWPQLRLLELPHRGKGATVRAGCLAAAGRRVLFMDADHATHIREVEGFLDALDSGADVVIGVRVYQSGTGRGRRILGLGFMLLAHLIVLDDPVIDPQCGFKAFTREAARTIFGRTRIDGGTIDLEVLLLAQRLGLAVHSHAVAWDHKSGSTISPMRCLVQDPLDMLRIRYHAWRLRHDLATCRRTPGGGPGAPAGEAHRGLPQAHAARGR